MKLSICIPTDNQKEELRELLHSLQAELSENVEVIICDNASTDESEVIARNFIKRGGRTLYYKSPKKISRQEHLIEAIDLATGDYCWFLQPGDTLKAGALTAALVKLDCQPNLAGLSISAMQQSSAPWPFLTPENDRSYRNAKSCLGDLLYYFGWTTPHLALRKPLQIALEKRTYPERLILSFALAKVVLEKPNWAFLSAPLLELKQTDLSIPEFEKMAMSFADSAEQLLGKASPLYFSVLNRMCGGPLSSALKALKKPLPEQTLQRVLKKFWAIPAFWSHQFPSLFADLPLTQKAFSFYRSLRKKERG